MEWGKYDDYAFSGECGRINPDPEIWEAKIHCPMIKFNNKISDKPTMAVQICRMRVEMDNLACLAKCDFAKRLKIYLDSNPEV
jgi:hypothetical protein